MPFPATAHLSAISRIVNPWRAAIERMICNAVLVSSSAPDKP